MVCRIRNLTRAVGYSVALLALSGGLPLAAEPSDCPDAGVGTTTGQTYHLQSQSLVTETRTVNLSIGGSCGVGGGTSGTYSEQYHVGYYKNDSTGAVAVVDCRTGRIIGWA